MRRVTHSLLKKNSLASSMKVAAWLLKHFKKRTLDMLPDEDDDE